ncbi:thioredoxin family protein [Algoriphagus resistens]|uniref:thioredoxin family protein n=1 Tax=Algoriphagus resistens TaxID=1750590 RepID=UPI00071693E5|nr:thioredoxin family protein [Algoriphagus resistens]
MSLVIKVYFAAGMLLFAIPAFGQGTTKSDKASAPDQEIVFEEGSWEEVAAQAKRTGKYIFVDAYTNWCAPCRLLKTTTFKEQRAARFYNTNFINYTADMEAGEGIELAEQWDITAYPALLFFSPEGKIVFRQIGFVDGVKLLEFGQQVLATNHLQ